LGREEGPLKAELLVTGYVGDSLTKATIKSGTGLAVNDAVMYSTLKNQEDCMRKYAIKLFGIALVVGYIVVHTAITATAETVCLNDATKKQKELIGKYNKETYYSNGKLKESILGDKKLIETIIAAVVDINNDHKPDIVYTDAEGVGSCGYSWSALLNLGNGKYKVIYFIDCTDDCLTFLPEMKNGFRVIKDKKNNIFIYDLKKHIYVEKTAKTNRTR